MSYRSGCRKPGDSGNTRHGRGRGTFGGWRNPRGVDGDEEKVRFLFLNATQLYLLPFG